MKRIKFSKTFRCEKISQYQWNDWKKLTRKKHLLSSELCYASVPLRENKRKQKKKKDKYQDLAGELIKLSNLKVTVLPIVIGVLGTVLKDL